MSDIDVTTNSKQLRCDRCQEVVSEYASKAGWRGFCSSCTAILNGVLPEVGTGSERYRRIDGWPTSKVYRRGMFLYKGTWRAL